MKQVWLFFLLCLTPVLTKAIPSVSSQNLTPFANTIYFGEQKIIKIKMTHCFLKYAQEWALPLGVQMITDVGLCPPLTSGSVYFPFIGDCYLSLIISGYKIGQVIMGGNMFHLVGGEDGVYWDNWPFIPFAIIVISHPFSMINIPINKALRTYFLPSILTETIRHAIRVQELAK